MTMSSGQTQSAPSDELTRVLVAKHLQGREREWTDLVNKTRPLHLLDLPLDILQAIIKEITHTNDLTSLALTHSALHTLVTPHIYARFDIVWPDAAPTVESRVGVDALTYGLATLVMAQDVFGEGSQPQRNEKCAKCGHYNFCGHRSAPVRRRKIRRGNNFARYTKKFSLGNGPEDWVKEYLITKEGGKMLGTLVALAVGRMRNLESFTWDMPTGVLRDVWLALASLDGREDGQDCRLERVWVRWHDNQDTWLPSSLTSGPSASSSHSSNLPHLLPDETDARFHTPPYPTVQFPTLSVLPPLRSLSVLDIDEMSYVEEMSVLLDNSLPKLRELRIGLAHHAQNLAWTKPKEDRSLVPPGPMLASEQRRGGLLGILVSRFCTAFNENYVSGRTDGTTISKLNVNGLGPVQRVDQGDGKIDEQEFDETDMNQLGNLLSAQALGDEDSPRRENDYLTTEGEASITFTSSALPKRSPDSFEHNNTPDGQKLMLETLELERISLSMPVLSRAFDWSRITSLTLLGCRNHEVLWKALRKQFTPSSRTRTSSISTQFTPSSSSFFGRRSTSDAVSSVPQCDFKLHITRLHTDTVSPTLLAFIKDTLAPDSLEQLFLQQSPAYKCSVTIDQIYKYAVRRHRASLRKLLIDSHIRSPDGSPGGSANWRKWAVSKELIACITSGRMQLRELSISIDYRDWHFFLQRLPNAQRLRSLHITHIVDYTHSRQDPKEVALQVLDIVTLKPELELSYLGIQAKCFEILEYQADRRTLSTHTTHGYPDSGPPPQIEEEEEDDSDEHEGNDLVNNDNDSDDLDLTTDQEDSDDSADGSSQAPCKTAFKLREILFYDDKISIFKARHGKL